MTEAKPRGRLVLRLGCILPGLALIALALADGPMIGGGPGLGLFDGAVLALGVVTVIAGLLPTGFAANYLAFFIAIMVTFAAVETVLQVFFRSHYFAVNDYDERVLFKLQPGASRAFTHLPVNGGETLVYHVNSDGFAGPELLPEGEATRVLVYGDSFMNAVYTPLEERFTSRLQTMLGDRLGRKVEVINAGIAGYGPDQILRRMETELATYKPDLVIVGIFTGNDFGDLLRNRLYRLDEAGTLVENDFRLSPAQARQIAQNQSELVTLRVLKNTLKRLRTGPGHFDNFDAAGWIDRALAQHRREYEEFVVQGDNTVGEFAVDPYTADIAVDADAPSSQYKIEMMKQVFAGIKGEAEKAGLPLLAVVIPHPMDVLNGDHASGKIDPALYPGYDPTRLVQTMSDIVAETGVPQVNLFAPFSAVDANTLYLKGGDDHWNSAGQALAAELVADQIQMGGYLN